MLRTLFAMVTGSILSVLALVILTWPLTAFVDLSFHEGEQLERFLLFAVMSASVALTSFASGYVSGRIAGVHETRCGLFSASLCVAAGVIISIASDGAPFRLWFALVILAPLFGAFGGSQAGRQRAASKQ
jgi:hypothetical protein